MELLVTAPVVRHELTVRQVREWLDGVCRSPKDRLTKERLKSMIG
jgi:hypothetical protein